MRPCPNSKCRSENVECIQYAEINQVLCKDCEMCGPDCMSGEEAVGLWDAIARAEARPPEPGRGAGRISTG